MRSNAETRKFRNAVLWKSLAEADRILHGGRVDLEAQVEDEGTVLHMAARMGHVEAVDFLLSNGAHVEARKHQDYGDELGDEHHATPLMMAAHGRGRDAEATMRRLIEAGADLNAQDTEGKSAIFYCLGTAERMKVLIQAGIDLALQTKDGSTILMTAQRLKRTKPEVVALLENAGAPHDGLEHAQLMEAAGEGHIDDIQRLLKDGADPNFRDGARTVLSRAAQEGHATILRMLLEAGANPDLMDSDAAHGDLTALCRAASHGHAEAVTILLEAGAHPNLGPNGIRPLDYAKQGKANAGHDNPEHWDAVIDLIRQAMNRAAHTGDIPHLVTIGSPGDYSRQAGALLDRLSDNLPSSLRFREVSALETTLLESAPLPATDIGPIWNDVRTDARDAGWTCFVTLRAIEDIEPDQARLEQDRNELLKLDADELFHRWKADRKDEEETDEEDGVPKSFEDGDEESLGVDDLEDEEESDEDALTLDDEEGVEYRSRETKLAHITQNQLPEGRSTPPTFGRDARRPAKCRLVFLKGGPELAPIFYGFGGWNAAPTPPEQGVVLEAWGERFGVELAYVGHDTLELYRDAPLEELAQLKTAALQIGLFCEESESWEDDLTTACSQTWLFWWD